MTAAAVLTTRSPATPADVVAELPVTPVPEVERAYERAAAAMRSWGRPESAAVRRHALGAAGDRLRDRGEEAADLIVREVGKPLTEARAEVARAAAILDYYAEAALAPAGEVYPPSARGLLFSERRPHGVAGLVTPWNFPVAIPVWKAAPALAMGNAVLLKPSPAAIGCAALLADVLSAELPDDVFTVLVGEADLGRALVCVADVVSFTGSAGVGRVVANLATARGRPVQAEMGGQNAAVVLPDADLDQAAPVIAAAAMTYAGQKCTATRRIVAVGHAARRTEVLDAVVAAVEALVIGDPRDETTAVGPVISTEARRQVSSAIDEGRRQGARLVTGGTAVRRDGWFLHPAVVTDVDPGAPLCTQETFGPLVVVQGAPDVPSAMSLANAGPYGLVTSVHGRDLAAVLESVSLAQSGLVRVNAPTTGVDYWAPFGGEGASSIGPREQGQAALSFYTSTRTVTLAAL